MALKKLIARILCLFNNNYKMERWKEIEGFENYEVSTHGRVRNKKRNLIMKPHNRNGYYRVSLSNRIIKRNIDIHRLVAQAFIDNPEDKPTVDHIDRNTLNNNIDNLRWATRFEQINNTSIPENATNICFDNNRNKYCIKIMRNGVSKRKRCKTREEAEAILAQFKAELGI